MSNLQGWQMEQTNTEQKAKVYKTRITTYIVLIYAVLNMIIGIALFILGIIQAIDARNTLIRGVAAAYLIGIGLFVILISCLVYIIGSLSKDVYDLVYFADYTATRNDMFYNYMLEHLRQLEYNQESIKSGIAVISSKLENDNERTRTRRYRREAENSQERNDEE